jgi:2-oxoglutarate ferredoxin oxidoreductase subunit beta
MSTSTTPESPKLTKKDFASDQDVRWCPGCGDYAILNAFQQVLPTLGLPREKFAVVSGIGCSSRFPYYLSTFGFHSIHGRAPTFATGLKIARPDLSVWVITGDGDALSIGGNHLLHAMRRNIDIKVLLFNNRIYGLTKGQYSPTSEQGKITASTPMGSLDRPVDPVSYALATEATFVARSVDVYGAHLREVLTRAAHHRGSAFVEIYQNCNIFNDGAWVATTEKAVRNDRQITLEHGKPMRFGKDGSKGLRLVGGRPEVVTLGEDGITEDDLWVHDEHADPSHAFLLAGLKHPDFPEALGVFRAQELPTFDQGIHTQIETSRAKNGQGDLTDLLHSGDTWTVD